jgi:hypothetical protein
MVIKDVLSKSIHQIRLITLTCQTYLTIGVEPPFQSFTTLLEPICIICSRLEDTTKFHRKLVTLMRLPMHAERLRPQFRPILWHDPMPKCSWMMIIHGSEEQPIYMNWCRKHKMIENRIESIRSEPHRDALVFLLEMK